MMTNYNENCRPIRILKHDSMTGPRIGGNPPEGILPEELFYCTEYFATFVIDEEEGREVSIFNSFEMDVFTDRSFLNNEYIVFPHDRAWFVQFVVHAKSERAREPSEWTSSLSSRALFLAPEEHDEDGWLESGIYRGSKMGGIPFYRRNNQSIRAQGKAVLDQGFVHLLQFGFPNDKDALPSGNWPYADYVLHVFVEDPKNPTDFRYGWG